MLSSLTITNMLLIDFVELEFKRGLNTLTGETGVGKSILLDCLGFVLGCNNNSQLVRDSTKTGEVVAEFFISANHSVCEFLEDAGIDHSDTIIIRRLINKLDGRKRNFINDQNVSLDLIKRLAPNLIELQGQTGNQVLLNEQSHLNFLDKFADVGPMLIEIQKIWKEKQFTKKELEQEIAQYEATKSQKEYLEVSISEIQDFDIQVDEEEKLDIKRRQVKGIQRNKEKFEKIDKLMTSCELDNNISDLIKLLDLTRQSMGEVVEESISALDRTLDEFAYARSEIAKLLESQNFDDKDLENIEDRLFSLRALGRKYNVKTNELPKLLDKMLAQLMGLDSNRTKISHLERKFNEIVKSYGEKANNLSLQREKAGKDLDRMVIKELKYLKMADCNFKTEILPVKEGPRGVDGVVFKVATNRGGEFGKLQAIASGGEMSRFLLALKVCLTDQEQGTTMIFDEIDRGIGGATADSVGRRLGMLAKHSQIIVVTHSPQVAAHGDYQWKVEKFQSQDNFPVTRIKELNSHDRLTEIARMLSGKEISDEALAAAKKLLD
ncbi:MAG: DNA repair protein RecN [Paracoccaceae bacterium]|nr:DNA repair protein RecN [Paracoccaceae bacterium]